MGVVQCERLSILFISQIPPSPPRFGAQARIHGLMSELARRHDLTAVMLVDEDLDIDECRQAMSAYCREVVLIRNPHAQDGRTKRLQQLHSLASTHSYERLRCAVPELRQAVDRILRTHRFDIVNLEFPYLGHLDLRQAPCGQAKPRVIVDSHEIAYDLARQFAQRGGTLVRRTYAEINWRKLKREEVGAYRGADGVALCSVDDERRLLGLLPDQRTVVVPNAADTEFLQPQPTDPASDGRTVVYFGLLSTTPNVDAVTHFVEEIWPAIAEAHPGARLKIIGGRAPASLLALAGPRIELTGLVPDLRPHLAGAAAIVVPLRLGGGTRLKIVEAMAMGKAIVSTTLGAEGVAVTDGKDILIADEPGAFAAAVSRLLADPVLAAGIGQAARRLAVERYSWSGAARSLEGFYRQVLGGVA